VIFLPENAGAADVILCLVINWCFFFVSFLDRQENKENIKEAEIKAIAEQKKISRAESSRMTSGNL